jgi:hypothetical protein
MPPKGGGEKPMPPVGKKGAKKGKPKAPKMPFGALGRRVLQNAGLETLVLLVPAVNF